MITIIPIEYIAIATNRVLSLGRHHVIIRRMDNSIIKTLIRDLALALFQGRLTRIEVREDEVILEDIVSE